MKSAVGIFMKAPVPGRVKTRLLPVVSADEAVGLYRAFTQDTIALVGRVPCHARVIVYWPEEARGEAQQMAPHGFMVHAQEGADLGERMSRFFEWCFERGMERVVIVGSDSPTLRSRVVEDALEALYDVPVVLGPCCDGGYYLVGLSRPMGELFRGIEWSSDRVFAQTVSRLKAAGERFRVLDPWYDVDVPESLRFLVSHVKALADSNSDELPHNTYNVISQLRMNGDGEQ